jgi:hypothetical protein
MPRPSASSARPVWLTKADGESRRPLVERPRQPAYKEAMNDRASRVLWLRVPEPMYEALRARAQAEDRTLSSLIRNAVRAGLEAEESTPKATAVGQGR